MLKKFWNWLLGKTTVDEKVVEVAKEIKKEAEVVKEKIHKEVVGEKVAYKKRKPRTPKTTK
jgi:hypothetical protein